MNNNKNHMNGKLINNTMKLYYLNPNNNYGQEYFVCAESLEKAFENILNFLKEEADKEIEENKTNGELYHSDYNQREYETWKKSSCDNLLDDYTLDVYEAGKVVRSEIC